MKQQSVAAIYCRLSKEDLDKANVGDDSESIQNQKLLLLDYATSNGFLVHNVYVDEDMSGFSDRPAFKQMIKDAASGMFNTIICKHQSRFTRDMELVEKYIHGYFVEWGIRFISLTDNVDTNVKGNKKARQIYGLINEWYSEDLSENIRAVFKKKMESGQYLGSFACYGYAKCSNNRHNLVVDEVAALTVKEIFSMYLEGYGSSRIAIMLTERGVPTPTQHKKAKGLKFTNPNGGFYSERYGAWSAGTIKRILSNEAYIGTLIQGRERKVSYKSKKVVALPRDEWIIIPDNHEPIVAKDTFYKVQHLMNGNRRRYGNGADKKVSNPKPHLLAGKLVCSDCGGIMQRSGVTRDGKTHYVRCRLAAKTKRRDCTPHCIRQDKIEDIVKAEISKLINQALGGDGEQEVINETLALIKDDNTSQVGLEKQLAEVTGKINQIQRNITMTYADKLNGVITEADFQSFKEVFEEEKRTHIKRKENLEHELSKYQLRQHSQDNILSLLRKHQQLEVLNHEIINDFIDRIEIGERDPDTQEQIISIKWMF